MIFVDKIKKCCSSLSKWRKENMPFDKNRINTLKNELEMAQDEDIRPQEDINWITKELNEAYREEELFWKQKSRNTWLKEGDNNSKFFHAVTKQRRTRNRIIGLEDSNGIWVEKDNEIEKVAVDYFCDIFTTVKPTDFGEVLGEVRSVVTEDMNLWLTRRVSEEEIKEALFLMHSEKSPGPDGMTALFYQEA